MTYERAHKYFEVKQRKMTKKRWLYKESIIAVNGKAIEAIEKQIPKKPKISKETTPDNFSRFKCPTCGNRVDNFYCAFCGQRLDWEGIS